MDAPKGNAGSANPVFIFLLEHPFFFGQYFCELFRLGKQGTVIRLLKVYYPLRTLVLLAGEALIVWVSFVVGTMLRSQDSWLLLNVDGGYLKIFIVTAVVLLLSHWLDLYDSSSLDRNWEQGLRILLVIGFVALALAMVTLVFPELMPGNYSILLGLIILTF